MNEYLMELYTYGEDETLWDEHCEWMELKRWIAILGYNPGFEV